MKIRNVEAKERPFAESQKLRIYLGNSEDYGPVILKIAKSSEDNDILTKEAGTFMGLQAFEKKVEALEKACGKEKSSRYDLLFAHLLQTFVEPSQKDRRINIYAIKEPNAEETDFGKLLPLSKLQADVVIDARSSVWVIGRILKLYSFFELKASEDEKHASYPVFSPEEYLIGPERHRLVYYNFSEAYLDVTASEYVKSIAKFILDWMVVEEEDEAGEKYKALLEDFAENGRDKAEKAHVELYELVEKLWGIHYYPFTYRKRNGGVAWNKFGGEV